NITYGTALSATQLNATVTEGGGALTYTPGLGTVLSAGTHILKVTAAATENYTEVSKEVTIVVDKADPVITIESSSTNSTYGDSVTFTVTASGLGGIAPTGDVIFRCVTTVLGTNTLILGKANFTTSKLEADDTHSPNALYLGDDNYNSATSNYLSHYVSKTTLTISGITIESKVYDGTTIGHLSSTGLLHGIVNGDNVTLDTTNASIEFADRNVGSNIPVTVSGLTLAGSGSHVRSYILTQPDGLTGNITPKPITISAENKSKLFDGAIYSDAYTVSFSGFVNAENETILNGSLIFTGEATTATSAGLYDIIPSGLTASNYEITFINGKLNIIDVSSNTNNIVDTKLAVTAYPNPAATDHINFKFRLKEASKVSIDIFDTKGLLVDCIFNENIQDNDIHIVTYKTNLPTGIYIYRLKSGPEVALGKLMIVK
ncbi:MAG TPA: YDG domain-containing protein, partial [Paludibacter sp.]